MAFKNLIQKEPISFLFGKLWRFAGGHKLRIVLYSIFFVIANLIGLLDPIILAKLLNEVQQNGITESNIWYLMFIIFSFLLVTLAFWLFHGIARIIEQSVAFYIRVEYRKYLLDGVLGLGLSWHGARDSGDTIDKVNKASAAMFRFAKTLHLSIRILTQVIGTTIVLYFFNVYIALIIIPFVLMSFFTLLQFDKKLVKQYRKLNLLDNRISAKIFDALSNVTSVVILNVQNSISKNIKKVFLYPRDLYHKNIKFNELKWFSGSMLFDILTVVPLAFYIIYVFKGNIIVEVGTISALYLYVSRLSNVFFTFGGYYQDVVIHRASVQNAASLEDAFETGCVKREAVPTWSELSIVDANFKYEDAEHHAKHLENISLTIKKGERIALIGESGSGKTTFLKVLHGLYDNAKAKVIFDGGAERETNFMSINLHTMLVPQEPELFSASIRENITFGVDYSDEEVEKVLELSQFSDVVDELPRGLKSIVNEKGVNLSGGQKQRLALARALLFVQDKDIVLLDESTSSVDPANEVKIYENIIEEFSEKTVLASIHKMNLLKYFDRIIMFEKGEIIDEGTFDELLERNKEFKSAWDEFIKSND